LEIEHLISDITL